MTMLDQRRPDAPREDLIRMSTSIRASNDGNTLVGYAAVFNEPTTIDSWEGKFIEKIARGAFAKTLKERGDQVKVLFNHGMDPSIGDKPLGKPSKQVEDSKGLAVECPLDDTSYNGDIKALLRSGALDGMSFRMSVINDSWEFPKEGENGLPIRTITEVKLFEWGPVTFPAYSATQAGVRAHAPAAFEAWRSATGAPKTVIPDPSSEERADADQQDDTAGAEATEVEDESGPDDQATRGTDEADEGTSPEAGAYQPAQRSPMSPERRESRLGQVRAWASIARSQ